MSTELRPDEARALAFLLNRIRPDWQTESTMRVLSQNKQIPSLGELTIAAITKAGQETARTPATIFIEGDHWPKPNKVKLAPAPRCEEHTGQIAHTCTCCWADIKLGERPEAMLGKRMTQPNIGSAPANVAAIKSELKRLQATTDRGES